MPVGRPPDPSDPSSLDPLIHVWERGKSLLRCHDSRFGATEFNPGQGGGRFHHLMATSGEPVPALYGSNTPDGAFSETVFHNVPIRGLRRRIRLPMLRSLMLSTLAPRRDLELAQLHGHGLRRLQVSRREIVETEANRYDWTRRWSEALHQSGGDLDGLVWVSRQHDTSLAVVLFGDRVAREDLEVVEPPLPLAWGPGLEQVWQAAEAADILVMV